MPQISQLAATYQGQIFWLLLTFGFVFLVVGRGMVPRVQKTIDGRDGRISGDLAAAKAARDAADAAEDGWRQRDQAARERVQTVLADARLRGAKATEARLAEAGAEQQQRLSAREADIRSAAERASGEIEAVAAEAARDIAQRVAGLSVSDDDARAAVRRVNMGAAAHV